jgi:hypothetical protein
MAARNRDLAEVNGKLQSARQELADAQSKLAGARQQLVAPQLEQGETGSVGERGQETPQPAPAPQSE